MSRSYRHNKDSYVDNKVVARLSNAEYKRRRAHQERMILRNELADLPRYEDDLDQEFKKWDKFYAKHLQNDWY